MNLYDSILNGANTIPSAPNGVGDILTRNTSTGVIQVRTVAQVLADIGAEAAFSKGSLVQGTNVTLSGTLTSRLVGSGNVTISVNGQVPVKQVFTYSGSNVFTLSASNPTIIYVALNGQVLTEGALYDFTVSGTQLTVTTPINTGNEITVLFYSTLPSINITTRNIDGGAPDSVYLAIQNVDGGTP